MSKPLARRTTVGARQALPADDGADSLARLGVLKAHWECWANCSLSCAFCYRSRDVPLDTEDARELIRVLARGGISELVFAGGDPSLRRDLGELLDAASEHGLRTEIQTNAQVLSDTFLGHLDRAELVGLSLDGPTAADHDPFRGRRGNFDRVRSLAEHLEDRGHPFVIRTVVSRQNVQTVAGIGPEISRFRHLRRWSLVQFTPIGDGYANRDRYEIADDEFHQRAWEAVDGYAGEAEVNVYPNSRKSGVYFIVGPSGDVHGRVDGTALSTYPSLGNILRDPLSHIVRRISFDPSAHASRYRGLIDADELHDVPLDH